MEEGRENSITSKRLNLEEESKQTKSDNEQ